MRRLSTSNGFIERYMIDFKYGMTRMRVMKAPERKGRLRFTLMDIEGINE